MLVFAQQVTAYWRQYCFTDWVLWTRQYCRQGGQNQTQFTQGDMRASYLVMTVRIVTKDGTTRDQLTTSLWCQRSASQSGSGEEGLRHWMAQTNEQAIALGCQSCNSTGMLVMHTKTSGVTAMQSVEHSSTINKECERQRVRGMLWGGGLTWSVIDMKCDQEKYLFC